MGEDKEEGRMEKGRILSVPLHLTPEVISRIVEGMDLIHPERFWSKA